MATKSNPNDWLYGEDEQDERDDGQEDLWDDPDRDGDEGDWGEGVDDSDLDND